MEPNHQVLLFFFYLLALIVTAPYLCGATEYYVRSTELTSTSCPVQPCFTFSQYINDAVTFFKSNTVFRFLSGTHEVNASVIVSNVHNISLLAEKGRNQPQVISYCPSLCSSNFNSGVCPDTTMSLCPISVTNATNITIAGLSIVIHPQSTLDIEVWMIAFGLGFTNISSLQLKSNTVFRFLSGTHEVNASVIVSNVHNISLLAEKGRNQPQVISYCPSLCSSNFNSGVCPDTTMSLCLISVTNATNITIAGLRIVIHPQSTLDIEVWMMAFGLAFLAFSLSTTE